MESTKGKRGVRVSAKAIVFREGCVLANCMEDEDGTFYILPGGGLEPDELLPSAVEREVAEETGLAVRAEEIAFIVESAQGEPNHRVDIVFRCTLLGESAAARHTDTRQKGFAWLKISTLNRAPLYPSRLRRPIMDLYANKKMPIYLGNENMGDPEITD